MRNMPKAFDAVRVWVQDHLMAEVTEPRWFRIAIVVPCLFLSLCGLSVYIIDPYHRYHKNPIISPYYKDEYRMIPNLLNTMDYDSLVAGTSMCLDFQLSDFRELLKWKKPIKIAASGCRPATFKRFTELAFEKHKISHVIAAMDISVLAKDPGSHFIPLESFLYNHSILDECAYLFNADIVFGANVKVIRAHLKHDPLLKPDLMFCNDAGDGKVKFGADRVWKMMRTQRKSETGWIGEMKKHDPAELEQRMTNNFQTGYLDVIRAHPETEFIFFYAPYSYLYWGCVLQEDMMAFLLKKRADVATLLLAEPNVKLFDFQADAALVTDLSHYRDMSHYSSAINHLIVERIAAGAFQCELGKVSDNDDKLRAIGKKAAADLKANL